MRGFIIAPRTRSGLTPDLKKAIGSGNDILVFRTSDDAHNELDEYEGCAVFPVDLTWVGEAIPKPKARKR